MLLPNSSCVYIQSFKSVTPRVCLAKVPFLAFIGINMKTLMGVVIHMYLEHSLDYIDSEYICIGSWSNSQGSSVFAGISFLAF